MEAHALHKRGWSVSAIARHLGRDRKTITAYLNGTRAPGKRRGTGADPFAAFEDYSRIRLAQDPHLLAMTLYDEIRALGYAGGYSTFTRAIRTRSLRPHCEPCHQVSGRDVAIIAHAPGAETQWDWIHLPSPPMAWDWPHREAYLLVGSLPHSGRWRGWLSPSQDQPHLVEGLHQVCRRLGGLTLEWRFDRMATVFDSRTQDLTSSFSAVARYYGVTAVVCPPRRGNRKGSVEKANDSAARRWWRTLADDLTPERAQTSLDVWCRVRGDARVRWVERIKSTVATVAAREPLAPLPDTPFPAVLEVTRTVSPQALVAFEGNSYSVPPGYRGRLVTLTRTLGAPTLDIISAAGNTLARHRCAPRGVHEVVRAGEHVIALEKAVLAATGDEHAPCRRKKRIPPSAAALAEAARLRAEHGGDGPAADAWTNVTDFALYAAQARPLSPATATGTGTGDPIVHSAEEGRL